MHDLTVFGDALVDFFPANNYTQKMPVFQCQAGGTGCNLSVAAANLGIDVFFVGKVGSDNMGSLVLETMKSYGVDTRGCIRDKSRFTTLSFICLSEKGERSFEFSRRFSAETNISVEEIDMESILDTAIFLYSAGMALTDEPERSTCMTVLKEAKNRGIITATDINYREALWKNIYEMIQVKTEALRYTDIYKSSEEEVFLLTKKENISEAAREISKFGCKIIIITRGANGSYYYLPTTAEEGYVPAYSVKVVDTTGAGDCFFGAFISRIVQRGGIDDLNAATVTEILKFANAAGALNVTQKGAVIGVPNESQIYTLIEQNHSI